MTTFIAGPRDGRGYVATFREVSAFSPIPPQFPPSLCGHSAHTSAPDTVVGDPLVQDPLEGRYLIDYCTERRLRVVEGVMPGVVTIAVYGFFHFA